jgi:hypothetical protein
MRTIILITILMSIGLFFQTCNLEDPEPNLIISNKTPIINTTDTEFVKCCNNMSDPWIDCIPGEIVGLKCQDGIDHGVTCECCRNTWLKYGPNPSYTIIPVRWLMYCDPPAKEEQ